MKLTPRQIAEIENMKATIDSLANTIKILLEVIETLLKRDKNDKPPL